MRTENVKTPNRLDGLPPLELLRSFEAAARRLSFTEAAAEVSLTQSAVSRQVQQLEGSLGVLLFERRHRALALTEAGTVLNAQWSIAWSGCATPPPAFAPRRRPARWRSPARRGLRRCG